MITLLSIFRNPTLFKSAVAMVPVTNLFQRLAYKGVERQHQAIDPANRYGGLPFEKHDIYKDRSPVYSVDKLQIPLYVGVTKNDEDVNIEEDMQLVDALRARKPGLAETMVYDNPPGGHTFDRRVDPKTWQPENTREQRDSWNRVWTFLDWNLDPFHADMHLVDEIASCSASRWSRCSRLAPARAQEVPRVRLVATGGTISNSTGGRLTAEELVQSMPGHRALRQAGVRAVLEPRQQRADARSVARARQAAQRDLPHRARHRRPGRHQRHRHARGARLLPRSHRPQRQAGGGRRIDAQPEHARLRRARRTCSRDSASPRRRTRAARARWSCSTTRSTRRARSPRPTRCG